MSTDPQTPLRIIPLGGLGEFGLNTMALEYDGSILVVDCGVMFPETAMVGIESVIPDLSYLLERAEDLCGLVLTHGHEDHIGAVPYLLEQVRTPVFGTRMTLGLLGEKLRERGLRDGVELRPVSPLQVEEIGPFQVEFLRVTHSIPDSLALAIRTPVGTVLHTADFKLDQTPVDGKLPDYHRFSHYGDEGVLLLLSDSTNAERPGYTPSERRVRDSLEALMEGTRGRLVVATFSSNIHRIQQVVDLAASHGRLICFTGRSILRTTQVAEDLGLLQIPPGKTIQAREVAKLPPHRVVVVAGGSQGEPRSALARIALGDHKDIHLEPGDVVVLSARPIPGNERAITRLVNHLTRRGARVVQNTDPPCHVSGHASQEELKLMIGLVRPRFFVPVHGEYRQLAAHARLARDMRMGEDQVLLAEDGDVIELTATSAEITGKVPVGTVLIDGSAGAVQQEILRDRRHLSGDGLLIPVLVIHRASGELASPPEMVSRGFTWFGDREGLLEECVRLVTRTVRDASAEERADRGALRSRVQDALRRFLRKRTRRPPMILPIIIET